MQITSFTGAHAFLSNFAGPAPTVEHRYQARKVVCFTGHRPVKIGGYDPRHPMRVRVREELKTAIAHMAEIGVVDFISGMALGVDTDAAELVCDAGLNLHAAVPFDSHGSTWPIMAQRKNQQLLNRAASVTIVSPGVPYSPALLDVRNHWMADRSDAVVAVWDGTPGGTANMVRYVERLGIPIIRIEP